MFYLSDTEHQQLPLFVYGTLRPSQENYRLLRGRTVAEQPAHAKGMNLYRVGEYPVTIPGDHQVSGVLLTLNPRIYHALLAEIDAFEGHRVIKGHFRRITWTVHTEHALHITAWIYIGSQPPPLESRQLIEHGDWVRYQQERIAQQRVSLMV